MSSAPNPPWPLRHLARLRLWLAHAAATEQTTKETAQHVVHATARLLAAAALRGSSFAGTLDGDHVRARLPTLQHLGEGPALIVGRLRTVSTAARCSTSGGASPRS
jgi:hypothetical protein